MNYLIIACNNSANQPTANSFIRWYLESIRKLESITNEPQVHILARTLIDLVIKSYGFSESCRSSTAYIRQVVSSTKGSQPDLMLVIGDKYSSCVCHVRVCMCVCVCVCVCVSVY
eukprot:GHVR01041812.1.p1 GENE.GHVR01041812.1~~GHVR01041812.1.p1  ORF type:complete len:115 (-),score=15.82 GHVR01041812.1:85-429(-)